MQLKIAMNINGAATKFEGSNLGGILLWNSIVENINNAEKKNVPNIGIAAHFVNAQITKSFIDGRSS